MHEQDGEVEAALELAQVGEQRGDLARCVLVDAMQSDERIEDEELGAQLGDRVSEAVAVALDVDPDRWRGDDVEVEVGEIAAGGERDAGEALARRRRA